MKETEKLKDEIKSLRALQEREMYSDILSFEYYNYRLENLVKKIKSKNCKTCFRACD